MVVAFYFRLHLAYFPRPVVAIFARPEHYLFIVLSVLSLAYGNFAFNSKTLPIFYQYYG